jgi:excisionase family DNA binding protein
MEPEWEDYQPPIDELISLKDAADLSGLSHDHLRRLAGQGKIWAKKIGRNWLTTEQAIKEYLACNKRPGPRKTP